MVLSGGSEKVKENILRAGAAQFKFVPKALAAQLQVKNLLCTTARIAELASYIIVQEPVSTYKVSTV